MSVAEDGRLFAWGSNEHGQLAMPRQISWQETPKLEFDDLKALVSPGQTHQRFTDLFSSISGGSLS